jgi:hypothetical protein
MQADVAALLEFFEYGHLRHERLRQVSRPFCELAHEMVAPLGEPVGDGTGLGLDGAEATMALRKLIESKDCAVRAALSTPSS